MCHASESFQLGASRALNHNAQLFTSVSAAVSALQQGLHYIDKHTCSQGHRYANAHTLKHIHSSIYIRAQERASARTHAHTRTYTYRRAYIIIIKKETSDLHSLSLSLSDSFICKCLSSSSRALPEQHVVRKSKNDCLTFVSTIDANFKRV